IEPKVFFEKGKSGYFFRIPVYGNSKLALHLFTQELADRIQEKGITVNASDPGIVDTDMITMHAWFDPITDLVFRPLINTPAEGAATAVHLALSEEAKGKTGCCYVNC
ncbi:MAG: SDR family NAD(P)-dependent oxidoreductase, partial [Parabacteroides sp.]|nr:SDR family NAD(P)-dependent oxidoreductase [Parabacteroides sp.]